jgi:type IV secretion system protein TrbJ
MNTSLNRLVSRRRALALMVAGIVLPRMADGQIVCANCSTFIQQLVSYAKEAGQYVTQLEQYKTQLQSYINMITNTLSLPMQIWSSVEGDIMQVQALSNAGSLLSGNSGSLIQRLQSAGAYADQGGNLTNIGNQFTMYQTAIGNNLSQMGKALGIQQGQEQNNAALLTALQAHSQNAQGQMQAIQAGNELAHQQATQLLQIQSTLSVTARMQATKIAADSDRAALGDAAIQHFNSAPIVSTSGYKEY